MIENPLSYILIKPNVITEIGIKEIREYMDTSQKTDLSVFDPNKSNETGGTEWIFDKKIRDTQIVDSGILSAKIKELMKNIVREIVNPFYKIEIYQSEVPQLLSYDVGGHYCPHIDSESQWISPNGEIIWKKVVERDLSMVLFINDDFDGGDFVFPDLKIRIRPEPGMLICFPSNHHYKHGVEPVTKGKRYSIVCWATVKGFPTREDINKQIFKEYGVVVNN